MKKKRTKFLDVAMLTCWCVGVLLLALFLGMTTVYAVCNGTTCDTYTPACSETYYRTPNGHTTGCYKLYGTNPPEGKCNTAKEHCDTCACLPTSGEELCQCACQEPKKSE